MNINFSKYKSLYCTSIVLFTLLFINIYSFSSASSKDASKFINDVSHEVIYLISKKNVSDDIKQKQLTALFKRSIDTDWIGKFSLGRYWRATSPEQQKEYLALFSDYLAGMYVPSFKKYNAQKLKINAVNEINNEEYLVQTELQDPITNNSIKIDYRLIKKENSQQGFMIFDIIAEGVSLISTQREEFSLVVARSGVDSLIHNLKIKNAQNQK